MKKDESADNVKVEKIIQKCLLRAVYNKNLINQPTYEKIINQKGRKRKKEVR